MSNAKRSSTYERHFQEVLRREEKSYEEYEFLEQEKLYFQQRKQPPNGTKNPNPNANDPRSPKK